MGYIHGRILHLADRFSSNVAKDKIHLLLCSVLKVLRQGVPLIFRAEIIPNEPDAGNAVEGIGNFDLAQA
jgi:hypothetical protein